jgi:hypothetical protein
MWVVIHMCMEATLGFSLYSYLYLKLAKTLCLSSTKSENKRVEQVLPGRGAGERQEGGGPNNVYICKQM